MAKYVDWYLVQMERRLRSALDAEQLHDTLMEAEAHLEGIVEELLAKGMDRPTAEQTAITRFGAIENLTGGRLPETRENPRGKWGLTAMLLVTATLFAAAGTFMASGLATAILWTAGLGTLFVSALTCLRRGRMPTVFLGGLLLSGLAGSSFLASRTYYSYDFHLARRSQKLLVDQALAADMARLRTGIEQYRQYLVQARKNPMPAKGYAVPWLDTQYANLNMVGIESRMRISDYTPRIEPAFRPVSDDNEWTSQRTSDYNQWVQRTQSNLEFGLQHVRRLEDLRKQLTADHATYSEEVLAGGLAGSAALTILWLAMASILNGIANLFGKLGAAKPRPISVKVKPTAYPQS